VYDSRGPERIGRERPEQDDLGSLTGCRSPRNGVGPDGPTLRVEDVDQGYGAGPRAWAYPTRTATVRA